MKLLTVHRAKGLEWDAVFLRRRLRGEVPRPPAAARSGRTPRPCCPRRCAATRADLPALRGPRQGRPRRLRQAASKQPRGAGGAPAGLRRLHPRPAPPGRLLLRLERVPARRRSGPRPYQAPSRESLAAWGAVGRDLAGEAREGHPEPAPVRAGQRCLAGHRAHRRGVASDRRRRGGPRGDGRRGRRPAGGARARHGRGLGGRRVGRRARAAARPRRVVTARAMSTSPLPTSLSATAAGPAAGRPRRASPGISPGRCRGRPRRRRGSAPASTPGSRPGSASRTSSTPRSCRVGATVGIDDESDLAELIATVRSRARSPTACRTPSRRRSRWCWPVRWCAAASTRSTSSPTARFLVVDWKTNRRPPPTRCSSRIYRLAWAELAGVPRRAGPRGVLLRAHRPAGRAGRPARPARS